MQADIRHSALYGLHTTNPIYFNVLCAFNRLALENQMVRNQTFVFGEQHHKNHHQFPLKWWIPYFVYLLKLFGFTWPSAEIFGKNERLAACQSCSSSSTTLTRSLSFILHVQRSGTHVVWVYWKCFNEMNTQKTQYFMMWNTREKKKCLSKMPNHLWIHKYPHTHTGVLHIQYICCIFELHTSFILLGIFHVSFSLLVSFRVSIFMLSKTKCQNWCYIVHHLSLFVSRIVYFENSRISPMLWVRACFRRKLFFQVKSNICTDGKWVFVATWCLFATVLFHSTE